jgi:hypothetical protein
VTTKVVDFDHLWRILERSNSIIKIIEEAKRRTRSKRIKDLLDESKEDSEYIGSLVRKYTH